MLLSSDSTKINFINKNQKSWIAKGPTSEKIRGKIGDLLSLIPIGTNAENISTTGLKYRLNKETLFFGKTRGISNEFEEKDVQIDFKSGLMLFIQTSSN
jgi:thiamine pyrophosphokinase